MTMEPHALAQAAVREAEALLAQTGVQAVVVLSPDGFDIARACHRAIDASRLAAMSASIAAVAEAMTAELHIGSARCVIVDATDGYAVVRSVAHERHPLVIHAFADRNAVLGMLLRCVDDAGRRLQAA